MKHLNLFENFESPVIGYHVTKKSNEPDIIENGIVAPKGILYRYGKPEEIPNDVYVWGDLEVAEWFKNFKESGEKFEEYIIKEIDLRGLKLRKDPETYDMLDWSTEFEEGQDGRGFIINGPIPSNRILN